jgi:hypothetical protein
MNLSKLSLFALFISILISCKEDPVKAVFTDPDMQQYTQSTEYTAIVYVDSTGGCTPCAFRHLNIWKAYQKTLNKHNTGILLVINHSDEQFIIEILKSIGVFQFVFDKKSKFKIVNYTIFKNASDGVFVIDKNKNVVFTGSPIVNEETWNSFVKLMNAKRYDK